MRNVLERFAIAATVALGFGGMFAEAQAEQALVINPSAGACTVPLPDGTALTSQCQVQRVLTSAGTGKYTAFYTLPDEDMVPSHAEHLSSDDSETLCMIILGDGAATVADFWKAVFRPNGSAMFHCHDTTPFD